MHKKLENLVANLHAMFTTHILLGIIGALLGTIALRSWGCRSQIVQWTLYENSPWKQHT